VRLDHHRDVARPYSRGQFADRLCSLTKEWWSSTARRVTSFAATTSDHYGMNLRVIERRWKRRHRPVRN